MLAGVTFLSSEVGGKKIVWMQSAGSGEMASHCLLKKTISQLAADVTAAAVRRVAAKEEAVVEAVSSP